MYHFVSDLSPGAVGNREHRRNSDDQAGDAGKWTDAPSSTHELSSGLVVAFARLSRGRTRSGHSRDKLATLLWGDQPAGSHNGPPPVSLSSTSVVFVGMVGERRRIRVLEQQQRPTELWGSGRHEHFELLRFDVISPNFPGGGSAIDRDEELTFRAEQEARRKRAQLGANLPEVDLVLEGAVGSVVDPDRVRIPWQVWLAVVPEAQHVQLPSFGIEHEPRGAIQVTRPTVIGNENILERHGLGLESEHLAAKTCAGIEAARHVEQPVRPQHDELRVELFRRNDVGIRREFRDEISILAEHRHPTGWEVRRALQLRAMPIRYEQDVLVPQHHGAPRGEGNPGICVLES